MTGTQHSAARRTFVIGVGMTKFERPGTKEGDYPDWASEAGHAALADASVSFDHVQQAYAGYCYGDSTSGQRCVYRLGLTGIPIINVNNNCATGSTALFLARQAVQRGAADCVLALGFERMQRGSLASLFTDRADPLDLHLERMFELQRRTDSPLTPQIFGNVAQEHMARYGSVPEDFAWIAWKNHKHSVNNPFAQFREEYSLIDITNSMMIHEPLTKLQCSPTSDGSAAAILASESFVDDHGLWDRAVEIVGQALVTDLPATFAADTDYARLVGFDMSAQAAQRALREAEIDIRSVDVIELHDCFSSNELISYEALGLVERGHGHELVRAKATTYGGSGPVVNPSGGLISKGHPLGATGLAQCAELTWQLRGQAGPRQVPDASVGMQHNVGLGGAAVVSIYRRSAR